MPARGHAATSRFCRQQEQREILMLKFYFNGAPNPNKVALFLEESGLAYELVPVDTRKGDQFKPEYPRSQPQRQGAGDRRRRRVRVRQQRHPALSRREDRQVPARQHARQPRTDAVMADVRRDRPRPLFGPGGAFQAFRAEGPRICAQPLPVRGATAITRSSTIISRKSRYMVGDTYTIVDMAFWGWARAGAVRARRRRLREISQREAAGR